eukprot:COSAG01_NODE_58080_length_308_cov_0.837321_1_plen_39_part_10
MGGLGRNCLVTPMDDGGHNQRGVRHAPVGPFRGEASPAG